MRKNLNVKKVIGELKVYQYDFSIIIPAFNTESYITEAIDSIINQTFPVKKIQIIIVNDGSTDNTKIIAQKYAEK